MTRQTLESWYPGHGYEYEVSYGSVDGKYVTTEQTGRVRDATGQLMTFDVLLSRTMNEARTMKATQESAALFQRLAV